jgi:hypothetical protein
MLLRRSSGASLRPVMLQLMDQQTCPRMTALPLPYPGVQLCDRPHLAGDGPRPFRAGSRLALVF